MGLMEKGAKLERFRTYPRAARCSTCGADVHSHPSAFLGGLCEKMVFPEEKLGLDYYFWCPGCKQYHSFRVKVAEGEVHPSGKPFPVWTFNGNMESPTFSPSLLCINNLGPGKNCHLFLREGKIEVFPASS